MQTLDYISSLPNCLELSQPSSHLDEATLFKVLYCIISSEDLVENCLVVNSIWLHTVSVAYLRPRHTMQQIAMTGCCNKSPRVTCENHCRCGRILSLRSVAQIQTGLNLCDVSQRQNKRKPPCRLVCTHLQLVAATKFKSTNEEASISFLPC